MSMGGGTGIAALLCVCFASLRSGTAAAQAPEPVSAELQAVLERADERFVQQDFQGAFALLEPSCAGSLEPACAFGLGAVQHALGHCEEAVRQYRRYRELAPMGEHTEEVLPALAQLEARCGGTAASVPAGALSAATQTPRVATPSVAVPRIIVSPFAQPGPYGGRDATQRAATEEEAHEDPGHGPLIVGLLGLAGGAALTALTTGILALNSAQTCRDLTVYDERFKAECQVREPRYRSLALGFGVASGALLAGGLTVWWLDTRTQASVGLSLEGTPELRYQSSF